ncbi:MAG: redoxin domain-containing protein [Cellulophaga sp.]
MGVLKIIVPMLVAIVALTSCTQKEKKEDLSFSINGTNWGKYEGHTLDIVVLDTSVSRTHSVAEKVVIKDGKFKVSDTLKNVRNAFFGLYNPNGDFVYKQEFILEPGTIEFVLKDKEKKAKVNGGKYNKLIYGFLEDDTVYKTKEKKLADYAASVTQESYKIDSIAKKYMSLNKALSDYKRSKFFAIYNGQDTLAKLLVFQKLGYTDDLEKDIAMLETKFGKDNPEIENIRRVYKGKRERTTAIKTVGIGSVVKDFTAKNIEDKEFKLSNVLKDNNYVLVEFWASWCGPCRAEIPHMKKAYKNFSDKGFEIVSFSLDHEIERWVKASKEEELPWINTGDLLAHKSAVVKMYGVSGIPANFLVDKTGTIIAKDLRQEKLDKKLEELLTK